MSFTDLIAGLEGADGPERSLDSKIAMMTGHRGTDNKVPYYTSSVDVAYELANFVAPSHVAGCKWGDGEPAIAQINDQFAFGATPALALCGAAVKLKAR